MNKVRTAWTHITCNCTNHLWLSNTVNNTCSGVYYTRKLPQAYASKLCVHPTPDVLKHWVVGFGGAAFRVPLHSA